MSSSTMHIGLADFAEPTLLILGDAASLNWLADRVESRQSLDFTGSPFVRLVSVSLLFEPTEGDGSFSRQNAKFVWKVSPSESQKYAEQLRALAASEIPAHAYLDSMANSAGVEVVASTGEYTADAVFI